METRFDQAKADRAKQFFERLLVHTKGRWAREPFVLADFQREIMDALFGQMVKDPDSGIWVRKHTIAWLELGRGNGKSELMAGIALLLTGGDDEESAEVYGVARDVDQASLVFNVAKRMVELSPALNSHFRIYPRYREIVYPKTSSRYKVVPGDALGNLGQDPHGILFDEIIAQRDGSLWDALRTGFKRLQPLMVAATTAGDDPDGFAKAEHDFSFKVQSQPELAPRRFVFIRSVPKDVDPGEEERWVEGNPALGKFLQPQTLRDEYHEAFGPEGNVRAQRTFRQFRLNQWQDTSSDVWMPTEVWDTGLQLVDEAGLQGRKAWGGLVAASTTDITSIAWVFPPKVGEPWQVIWRFFMPEDSLPGLVARTNGTATTWVKEKRLQLTEGDQIDVEAHVTQIQADIQRFDARELVHHRNVVLGIIQPIMAERPKLPIGIGYRTPGGALLDWEALIRQGQFMHGGHPIPRWEVGHALAKENSEGTLRFDQTHSSDEISGIAAAELALRRALVGTQQKTWTYEGRIEV